MNTNWTPATIPAESITAREEKRAEDERGCGPIEYAFTPQEKDVATIARLDVLAIKHSYGQFTPGLVVIELDPSDLSESERESYVRFGGAL